MVPAGTPLAGAIVNVAPLHIEVGEAGITGFGLTVTVTKNDEPVQPPTAAGALGVTVYVTLCCELVGLVSVWLIDNTPTACALDPVTPPVTAGTGHVYVVPTGTIVAGVGFPSTGLTVNVAPLQIEGV